MAVAIQANHRAQAKISQRQRTQAIAFFTGQQLLRLFLLFYRQKGDRLLYRQADLLWTVVGCQPKVDLSTARRIAPVSGQNKTLARLGMRRGLRGKVVNNGLGLWLKALKVKLLMKFWLKCYPGRQ